MSGSVGSYRDLMSIAAANSQSKQREVMITTIFSYVIIIMFLNSEYLQIMIHNPLVGTA